MRSVTIANGSYTVQADLRDGGAVGLYITGPKGDTIFILIPGPAVAATIGALRALGKEAGQHG